MNSVVDYILKLHSLIIPLMLTTESLCHQDAHHIIVTPHHCFRSLTPLAPALTDEPRQMSLESRIQSLLQMQGGDDSQEDETGGSDNDAPPLPPPPDDLPPPPPLDNHVPPPLPDYPPEVMLNDTCLNDN